MAGRTRTRANRSSHPATLGPALVASAAHFTGAQAPKVYGVDKEWQAECYRFYSLIGEARYAAQYYGNAMSKCELFMAEPVVDIEKNTRTLTPSYNSDEAAFLDDVFSGQANQSQMLHDIGVHLTISGECFVVGRFQVAPQGLDLGMAGDGGMIWEVISPLEMQVNGRNWQLKFDGQAIPITLTDADTVVRIWQPDPYQRLRADSPFKSLLPVLKEIENATLHIYTQLISRLAGNGIFFVAEGMDFPEEQPKEGEEVQTQNGPGRLMKLLVEAGSKAIADPASPAARLPIIVQVPDDLLDKAGKLVHFWSPLDEKAGEIRDKAIHRFASGMDLPNEMTEGMSSNTGTGGGSSNGVSHWGAWQIEEQAIKIHIEPKLELICSALTVAYIRFQVPGTTMVVRYSTKELRLRPDRSKEAMELNQSYLISDAATRREVGFTEDDAPTEEEVRRKILISIASGSATPEMVWAANELLGTNLPMPPPSTSNERVPELPPAPSLEDHPTRPRDPSEVAANLLIVACNAMVITALSRVGARLIQAKVRPPESVPNYAIHTFAAGEVDVDRLLADAFPFANEMLEGIADPADVMPCLTRYTASLVATKAEHSREEMAKWLEAAA